MKALAVTRVCALAMGFAFLYTPIALLVLYSFNASRLVTVWAGFSTRWYEALLHDSQLLESARISLAVATCSAAIATMMGTIAAFALDRFGPFRTRTFFSFTLHAPLVLPEVILGLSLLLVFVAFGVDRGLLTLIAAHATLTMCFATVVVRARLSALDRALEEAAADLGASPSGCFLYVTLPLIAPALVSAYLLSFTLSLDDLVIASFASGPGATTLPMRIYSQVRLGVTPEINAMSALVLAIAGIALLCASRAARGDETTRNQ